MVRWMAWRKEKVKQQLHSSEKENAFLRCGEETWKKNRKDNFFVAVRRSRHVGEKERNGEGAGVVLSFNGGDHNFLHWRYLSEMQHSRKRNEESLEEVIWTVNPE